MNDLLRRRRAMMGAKDSKGEEIEYLATVNSAARGVVFRDYFKILSGDECEIVLMPTELNNGDNAFLGWQSEFEIYINKNGDRTQFFAWNSSTFTENPPSSPVAGAIYTLNFKFTANITGLRFFSYNGNAAYVFSGRIYSIKIKRGGETVLNLVPRIKDAVPGMYDTVQGGFFPSHTPTQFITP